MVIPQAVMRRGAAVTSTREGRKVPRKVLQGALLQHRHSEGERGREREEF